MYSLFVPPRAPPQCPPTRRGHPAAAPGVRLALGDVCAKLGRCPSPWRSKVSRVCQGQSETKVNQVILVMLLAIGESQTAAPSDYGINDNFIRSVDSTILSWIASEKGSHRDAISLVCCVRYPRMPAVARGQRSPCPTQGSSWTVSRVDRAGYRPCSVDAECYWARTA